MTTARRTMCSTAGSGGCRSTLARMPTTPITSSARRSGTASRWPGNRDVRLADGGARGVVPSIPQHAVRAQGLALTSPPPDPSAIGWARCRAPGRTRASSNHTRHLRGTRPEDMRPAIVAMGRNWRPRTDSGARKPNRSTRSLGMPRPDAGVPRQPPARGSLPASRAPPRRAGRAHERTRVSRPSARGRGASRGSGPCSAARRSTSRSAQRRRRRPGPRAGPPRPVRGVEAPAR